MKKTIITVLILSIWLVSKGQVFRDKALYHDSVTRLVKTKYYSYGLIRKPSWNVDKVDAMGRTIERKGFSKNKLSMRAEYLYNSNGDVIREIYFDYLNSTQADTTVYEYEYRDGRIALQKETYSRGDSTTYKLIGNNDTDLIYQRIIYHYLSDKKLNNQVVQIYTFTYDDNLLISQKMTDTNTTSQQIITYKYYDNGKLKRRIIERLPKNRFGIVEMYAGGPASDDQSYSYSYDKEGHVAEYFTTVNGKMYKLASYRYK